MDDLVALKREIMNQTRIKIKNEDLDKALDNLNDGALNELTNYTMLEFEKDFEMVNSFWDIMINFMNAVRQEKNGSELANEPEISKKN